MKSWWSFVLVTLGAAIFLAGLVLSIQGLLAEVALRRESLESGSWPSVPGTVTTSRLEVHRTSMHLPSGGTKYQETYEPTIAYSYEVAGRQYDGARIRIVSEYDDETARDLVARYRIGDNVQVWYRPGDPPHAVLEPRSWGWWRFFKYSGWCVMCVVIEMLIALIFAGFVRQFRETRSRVAR